MSYLAGAKSDFDKVIDHLKAEMNTIRTGRANPSVLDEIQVEAYGTYQPIKAMASISTPDAKTIQIDPWDSSATKAIEIAIMKSDIGLNPNVDGKTIRLFMPMMTEETRKEMVKKMKGKLEDAKVSIRKVREDVKKNIESQTDIGLDLVAREMADMEREVKKYYAQIEELGEKKEAEVMSI